MLNPLLPVTEHALVLRADFSDDRAWTEICRRAQAPSGPFQATVDCVSDPSFDRVQPDQLLGLLPPGYPHSFLFLVDAQTLNAAERPVLVVDLTGDTSRTFRVIPSEMWGIENNLSIGNMDFEEFADAADDDGVFRGF